LLPPRQADTDSSDYTDYYTDRALAPRAIRVIRGDPVSSVQSVQSVESVSAVCQETTSQGDTQVQTTDTTLVEKYTTASVGNLKAGERVVVSGTQNVV